jgi:hypothetical protein
LLNHSSTIEPLWLISIGTKLNVVSIISILTILVLEYSKIKASIN